MEDEVEEEEEVIVEEREVKQLAQPLKKKDYRVLITNGNMPKEALDILSKNCEIHVLPSIGDSNVLMRYAQGMDGLLIDNALIKLDKEFFRGAGLGLKVVSIVGLTGDQIDVKEAAKRKLKIGVCPSDVALDGAAEVAIGLALALCRRIKEGNNSFSIARTNIGRPDWLLGQDLMNCNCGILGLGKLGVSVAVRLLGFRPKSIFYYSRRAKTAGEKLGIPRVLMNDLFKTSDLLFICLPCNVETRGLINETTLMKMKKNSILINISHRDLVNINDLYCALRKGVILAAGMDVDVSDKPSPNHPIYRLNNFIMLPNIGKNTVIVKLRMNILAAENLVSGLNQKTMLHSLKSSSEFSLVETEEERVVRTAVEAEKFRLEEIERKIREEEDRVRLEEEKRLRIEAEEAEAKEEADAEHIPEERVDEEQTARVEE